VKKLLRRLFAPILNILEAGDEPYLYKPSHRNVLLIIGALFTGLASLVLFLAQGEDPGYLIPVIVFGSVGLLSLLVGLLGSDRAVARIWGSGK